MPKTSRPRRGTRRLPPGGRRGRRPAPASAERARLYELFMRAPAIIAVVRGPDHVFEMANPPFLKLIGRRAEEVIGKPARQVLPEMKGQGYWEILDKVLATGEPFIGKEMPAAFRRPGTKDLKRVFVSFVFQPTLDKAGKVEGIMGQGFDVTAELRAREEAGRLQRLYDTILSSTPDLVYVFGLDHRFIYCNRALLRMWGKTWSEAVGRNCLELGYPPWHAAMHDREIEEVVATKKPIRGEVPFTGTNGRRMYDYIFVPVLGAKGQVEAVAGTTRDVTELRGHASRLASEVAARTAELKRSIEELERFTYTVAHDLRAPLRAVHRFTEMLLTRGLSMSNAEKEDHLRNVAAGAKRMDRLIEDLLSYSKIGQSQLILETVDTGALVVETVQSFSSEIQERGATVKALPDGYPRALGDRFLLGQALSNLLDNALKFMPEGRRPVIEVGAERAGDVVRLWVRDNGIGIEPEYHDRVFHLFERLHPRDRYPGTGIGLAIVSRAVERVGGKVGFDSTPGKGSRFWITLKAAQSHG